MIATEETQTNPLTTYANANEMAEQAVLPLASDDFVCVVLRQATVYGFSPRMRFDLAINGMTFGAWKTGVLPLMRDGTQWRPNDPRQGHRACADFHADGGRERDQRPDLQRRIGREQLPIGAAGGARCAAKQIAARDVKIEWYGEPDHRSYRIDFHKVTALGYHALYGAEDGVKDICEALISGKIDKTTRTITLDWYRELIAWHERIRAIEMYGGVLKI